MKVLFLTKTLSDGEEVSEHIKTLAEALISEGHEAEILSFDDGESCSVHEEIGVETVSLFYEGDSLYSWAMMFNNELKRKIRRLLEREEIDIIHAHDWVTVPAATAATQKYGLPMALTLHSTENERGFNDPNSEVISELEWKGSYSANKVFVNREATYRSVRSDLEVPDHKICKINPLTQEWEKTVMDQYEKMSKQLKTEKTEAEA